MAGHSKNRSRFLMTVSTVVLLMITSSCGNNKTTKESSSTIDPSPSTSTSIPDVTSRESTDIEEFEGNLLYRLGFNGGIGNNDADTSFEDASIIGDKVKIDGEHKGSGVLAFENNAPQSSYLSLPNNLLNKDVITISSWVYLPDDINRFNNKSPLFSIEFENDEYFYVSPFDTGTWFSYAVESHFNDSDENLTLAPPSKDCYWENTPTSGTIQSPAGAWHLIGFTFTDTYLHIYQNGHLMLSFDSNFSLKNKVVENFYIGTSSYTGALDYNGKISDFRIYDSELKLNHYSDEYSLSYNDFLTTDWEFNGSLYDEVRQYEAKANGNAILATKDDRQCIYLDGSQVGSQTNTRTSLTLPNQTLMGHNEITISTDLYLINSMDRYQRVFEFSIKGARYFALYVGFSDTNDLKLEYVPHIDKARHIALEPSYVVPTEEWINITVTANKDKGTIYVNGLIVAEGSDFAYDPVIDYYYPDLTCTIGRTDFYGDKPLSGYIDNFKMYSVALTTSDVMKLNNVISIEDDEEAVRKAADEFEFTYKHDTLLSLDKYGKDGVRQSFASRTPDLVDSDGRIYPMSEPKEASIDVTFSRGVFSMTRNYKLIVKNCNPVSDLIKDVALDSATYDSESYFDETMLSNIDYMFSLDVERLLYNYRLNSQLSTKGARGYQGWIGTSTGGAGQFETQYIGALARYTKTMPDYVSKSSPVEVNTPLKRLTYMLNEIRKCQIKYGDLYPEQTGYLSAFTHLCIKAIESGTSSVGGGDGIHGTIPIGGVTAWVPFYMYHKNLMMCYDVYKYVDNQSVKELALQMLIDASDWCYNEISSLTSAQRSNVLGFEYGGMTEVMYLTYQITKNPNYLKVARFFEQESLLDNLYNNKNCLTGLHTNTTIPKILGCAAAYQVTGDTYYKTICENFWNMVTTEMCYVNGGVSINEHFEEAGVTSQCTYGEETCCSYNMLMLSDYLYRWSGESKYMDYFENVFYNHIMASIDPATAGKTYPSSTTFGYHKIYSEAIDAFWCCCCTGQETFSKLVYGNYHVDDDYTYIQMYNPTTYKDGNGKSVTISGNLAADEEVHIKVSESGTYKLKLRKPTWTNPEIYINGVKIDSSVNEKGYITINQNLNSSDNIVVKLPMKARLEQQKGVSKSYALFYGPYMCVCDLGIQEGDKYLSTNQTGTYRNTGFVSYDGAYRGNITQVLAIQGFDPEKINEYVEKDEFDGKIALTLEASNQTVTFIPWMDCIYNRYSMYMYYFDSSSTGDFEIEGTITNISTANSDDYSTYKEKSTDVISFREKGIALSSGEQKVIYDGVTLNGNYEAGFTMSGTGSLYGGLYLGASDPHNQLDMIKALNVNVERDPNTDTFRIMVYQFNQAYLGCIASGAYYSTKNEISLRVVVKDGYLYVFTDDDTTPRINIHVDESWTNGKLGIRNQGSSTAIYSNLYYKQ